jgi:hypothetical protein
VRSQVSPSPTAPQTLPSTESTVFVIMGSTPSDRMCVGIVTAMHIGMVVSAIRVLGDCVCRGTDGME